MTDFALDILDELAKIRQETVRPAGRRPAALALFVRLAMPKGGAAYDLSGKFGASPEEAAALLRAARPHAARLGLPFMSARNASTRRLARAMALAAPIIVAADVPVEVIDIGGGFPAAIPI